VQLRYKAIEEGNIQAIAGGLCDLEARLRGHQETPGYWRWRYLGSPAGPGASVVALNGESVVGKLDGIAVPVVTGGTTRPASVLSGFSVDHAFRSWETYRGMLALSLQQGILHHLHFGIAFSNRKAAVMNRQLGWSVLGRLPVLAGLLNWRHALEGLGVPRWIAAPAGVLPSIKRLRVLNPSGDPNSVVEIPHFDREGFDRLWEDVAPFRRNSIRKDGTYLQWRYPDCPGRQYHCLAVFEGGLPQGYLVYRYLSGRREFALLELEGGVREPESVMASLMNRFLMDLPALPAGLVRASFVSTHPAYAFLLRSGFGTWPTRISDIHVVLAASPADLTALGTNLDDWFLTLGDWMYY